MKRNLLTGIEDAFSSFGKRCVKHLPKILAANGVIFFGLSTYSAVNATPQATKMLENKKKELKKDDLTFKEKVSTVGKLYLPAIGYGVIGTGSICASVSASQHRYNKLAVDYGAAITSNEILRESIRTYQDKVVETIGEKKEQKIQESIARDKAASNPPTDLNTPPNPKNYTVLVYEPIGGFWFWADIIDLKTKILNTMRDQDNYPEGYFGVQEFYMQLDAGDQIPEAAWDKALGLGWNKTLDGKSVDISLVSKDDAPDKYANIHYYVIRYDMEPHPNYDMFC